MNQDLPGPSKGAEPQQAASQQAEAQQAGPQQAAAVDPTLIKATPLPKTKEWHNSFNLGNRNFLIRTLMDDLKEIFPTTDISPVQGMNHANYAKMIESDVYQVAVNRIDYIVKLVEKIYAVKEEYRQQEYNQGPSNTPEDKQKIQISLAALEHASICYSSICFFRCCNNLKECIEHVGECPFKTRGGCRICRQFMALCCLHAKYCTTDTNCPVMFCGNIKIRIRIQRRLLVFRRMAEIVSAM